MLQNETKLAREKVKYEIVKMNIVTHYSQAPLRIPGATMTHQ